VWDLSSGHLVFELRGGRFKAVVMDAAYIFTGDLEGEMVLWDALTGNKIRTLKSRSVYGVGLSPDGHLGLSVHSNIGHSHNTVRLWDLTNGALVHVVDGFKQAIRHLRFTSDGSLAVLEDINKGRHVIQVSSGQIVEPKDAAGLVDFVFSSEHGVGAFKVGCVLDFPATRRDKQADIVYGFKKGEGLLGGRAFFAWEVPNVMVEDVVGDNSVA